MVTHDIPPAAEGGWSEFIKNFGIGFLRRGCGGSLATGGQRAGSPAGGRANIRTFKAGIPAAMLVGVGRPSLQVAQFEICDTDVFNSTPGCKGNLLIPSPPLFGVYR